MYACNIRLCLCELVCVSLIAKLIEYMCDRERERDRGRKRKIARDGEAEIEIEMFRWMDT